jgi:hypothetical protein
LPSVEAPLAEALPEASVRVTLSIAGVHEDAVVFASDLFDRVAHRLEEVFVGPQDVALEVKLDHRLGLADRLQLPFLIGLLLDLLGDVGGELHHLVHLAIGVHDRVVGGLDPDLPPVFADPLVLGGVELAGPEALPNCSYAGLLR